MSLAEFFLPHQAIPDKYLFFCFLLSALFPVSVSGSPLNEQLSLQFLLLSSLFRPLPTPAPSVVCV